MIRLTREQVREIDRRAIEEYHIPGIVLMENAARGVADVALAMRRSNSAVAVVCGGGNNGGDGLAVARHLHNAGWHVDLVMASDRPYAGDAAINHEITRRMRLPETSMFDAEDVVNLDAVDLVIDALFGTGLNSPPRPDHAKLIEIINQSTLPVLAVDLPSGLNCDTGQAMGAAVRAVRTVTFVAEKAGFSNPGSKRYTGEVIVADIGCPKELIQEVAAGSR